MLGELIPQAQRKKWNEFAAREPHFGLMQSWEWGDCKQKQGWKPYRFAVYYHDQIIAAAQMLIKHLPLGLSSIAYIPRGPTGRWLDPDVHAALFTLIHKTALEHHVIFLKVEPPIPYNPAASDKLQQFNFRPSPATNQPRATILLDLTPDLNTIFERMRKTTRRKVKNASRKGITFRVGTEADLPIFYQLMKITSQRAGFVPRPFHYYQTEWQTFSRLEQSLMMLAFYEERPVAVHINYLFGQHAAFFHQVSSRLASNLNPNSMLIWEAIKLLKERSCTTYDLWGIPDEIGQMVYESGAFPNHKRTKGLWGPYQFKSGFGKNVVYYLGAYDYVYHPFLYSIISRCFFRANTLERISIWMEFPRPR